MYYLAHFDCNKCYFALPKLFHCIKFILYIFHTCKNKGKFMVNSYKYIFVLFLFILTFVGHVTFTDKLYAKTKSFEKDKVVLVVDSHAVLDSPIMRERLVTLMGLLSGIDDSADLYVISSFDPVNPVLITSNAKESLMKNIFGLVNDMSDDFSTNASLVDALNESHSLIKASKSTGRVYFVTGSSNKTDFSRLSRHLMPIVAHHLEEGIKIDGVTLSKTSNSEISFLNTLTEKSGGEVFKLASGIGFRQFADAIITQKNEQGIDKILTKIAKQGEVLQSRLPIYPGTLKTMLFLFKENSGGELRLVNPNNFEVKEADLDVVKTPYVNIWEIYSPSVGDWSFDLRDVTGNVSVWQISENDYSLNLISTSQLSVNESTVLMASLNDSNGLIIPSEVHMQMKIVTPNSDEMTYEMLDNGKNGDSYNGDGYFSTLIPAETLKMEGEYDVSLMMYWDQSGSELRFEKTLDVLAFPTLDILRKSADALIKVKSPTVVGTANVYLRGMPYKIDPTQISGNLTGLKPGLASIELRPRNISKSGKSDSFDIIITADYVGKFTEIIKMDLIYGEDIYLVHSDSYVTEVVNSLPSTTSPLVVNETTNITIDDLTKYENQTDSLLENEQQNLKVEENVSVANNINIVTFSGVLLIVFAMALIFVMYLLHKYFTPMGFILDDSRNVLFNFSNVNTFSIKNLFLPGRVLGKNIGLPGLEDVVFHFTQKGLRVSSATDSKTIRVDNQPVVRKIDVVNGSWLGSCGKLYSFSVNR